MKRYTTFRQYAIFIPIIFMFYVFIDNYDKGLGNENIILFAVWVFIALLVISSTVRMIKITDDEILIKRVSKRYEPLQLKYKIKINDIKKVTFDFLKYDQTTSYTKHRRIGKIYTLNPYTFPCMVFHLHSGERNAFVITEFSKRVIGDMIEQLSLRGLNFENISLLDEFTEYKFYGITRQFKKRQKVWLIFLIYALMFIGYLFFRFNF